MTIRFHSFPSAQQATRALAEAVAQDLRQTIEQRGEAVLAVSGGRSPVAFFHALSQSDLDWGKVGVTLVDERVVPTEHADSNTALVRQNLLQNRAAAARWIPLIEDDAADLQPERTVRAASAHYRRPDVLVLGMGADGHTASLFPQSPQLAAAMSPDCAQPLMYTRACYRASRPHQPDGGGNRPRAAPLPGHRRGGEKSGLRTRNRRTRNLSRRQSAADGRRMRSVLCGLIFQTASGRA